MKFPSGLSWRNRTVYLLILCGLMSGCGRPRRPPVPVPSTPEISAQSSATETTASAIQLSDTDWPMWRGPNQDGIAVGSAPTQWSETENVVWKSEIPGRGHSSPIIIGDRIYLETADEQKQIQSVLCLNRTDGKQIWQTEVHRGQFEDQQHMHPENTQASSTLACDGNRLFVLFLNDRKIWISSIDLEGHVIWQKPVGEFASKFGYSASPALFENLCLVSADHSSGGFIAAVHRESGEIVWRKARERGDSYASPRVVTLGDRPQAVLGGVYRVISYDPHTGEQNWSTAGTTEAVVGTVVISGDMVVASGGYPDRETIALKPDGSVAWRNQERSYVPSLIAYKGHVFLANDEGVVICWDASGGHEKWKHRIGGKYRVSPLIAGGNVYITDMSSKTTVFRASPDQFQLVSENQLGTEAFASPAVSQGQLFLRVADASGGGRKEYVYCLGESESNAPQSAAE